MADRFSAQIWIGGQISRTARLYPDDPKDDTTILRGLIGALHEDRASHEYGDAPIPCDCTEEDLGNYLSENGHRLRLKNDEAYYGEFPETEQFCMEHDIPFNRWSDHHCEYSAEFVSWRPGMKRVQVVNVNSRENEIVEAVKIREALAILEEIDGSTASFYGLVKTTRLLRDVCPELPPELEIFNITA